MAKKLRNPIKEKQEWLVYALFYFFITSFVLKSIVGLLFGSKFMLASGAYALFGVCVAAASLVHIGAVYPGRGAGIYFNHDKLEFIVIFGVSVVIALSMVYLIFSTSHMLFFHTLYPADLLAAWVGIFIASLSLSLMVWVNRQWGSVRPDDERKLTTVLICDFILSVLAAITVVISRAGWFAFDYIGAIILALSSIVYSISFFFSSFKGLMDASCDKKTVSFLENIIRNAQGNIELKTLRVSNAANNFEIIALFSVPAQMPISDMDGIIKNIQFSLKEKFTKPHEIFVGIHSV